MNGGGESWHFVYRRERGGRKVGRRAGRQAGRRDYPAGVSPRDIEVDAFACGCEGEFQRFRLVTDLPRSPGLPSSPLSSASSSSAAFFSGATTLRRFLGATAYPANYLARFASPAFSVSEGWLVDTEGGRVGTRAEGALEFHWHIAESVSSR